MSSHSNLLSRLLVVLLPPGADRATRTRILEELQGEIADDVEGGVLVTRWLVHPEDASRVEVEKPEHLYVVADYAGHDGSPFATLLEHAMRAARDFRPSNALRDRSRILVFTHVHPRHWSTDSAERPRRATRRAGGNGLVPDWCIVERK